MYAVGLIYILCFFGMVDLIDGFALIFDNLVFIFLCLQWISKGNQQNVGNFQGKSCLLDS